MELAPPVPGARIISRQGCRTLPRYTRDELRDVDRALCPQLVEAGGVYRWHNGVDFAAPEGSTIVSVGAGRIRHVYQRAGYYDPAVDVGSGGYGRTIVVELAPGVLVVYAHCRATRGDVGGLVELGEPVAEVGRTNGSAADPFSTMDGAHLHLEFVRRWPLRSSDVDQRFDVLGSLAARGIVERNGRMVWATPATSPTAPPAVDSTPTTATGPAPTPRDGPDAGPILALGALFALGRRRRDRRGRDGP